MIGMGVVWDVWVVWDSNFQIWDMSVRYGCEI